MTSPLRLVSIFGTGDTYLVCSLLRAAEQYHGRPAELKIKSSHAAVAWMFGIDYQVDDKLVQWAETTDAQADYDNDLFDKWRNFFVHPRFTKSQVRIDLLTAKDRVSMADMYRALLRLPLDTPTECPTRPVRGVESGRAVLIPRARSWPTDVARLWPSLASALRDAGWRVIQNDESRPLDELLWECAGAEWVIGPQCGVMSILCHAQFPCRKTIITPSIDGFTFDQFPPKDTFPYAYVTKFAGEDYDVEELLVTEDIVDYVIERVVNGANALRLWPHDPRPVQTIMAPLTPGEFIDRLAILTVKTERMDRNRMAAVWREFHRYAYIWGRSSLGPDIAEMLEALVRLHRDNFDILEQMVPDALQRGAIETEHHIAAMKSNQERVEVKRRINELAHSPYPEVKSYYG